jgi:ATP-binding cassette subfamily C protein CydD
LSIEKRLIDEEPTARGLLLLATLAGFFAAAAYIFLAYFLSDVVNRVFLEKQTLGDVLPSLYKMLLLLLMRGLALWGRELFAQRSASSVKSSLRRQLSNKLFLLGPLYTRTEHSGELTNTFVEGVENLDPMIAQYLPAKALAVLVPTLVFLVILILDPWTTLVLLVAGPMMLLILALIGGRARAITERRFLEMSWMSAFFLDILQGLPTLKMFGREREQVQNIREISDHYGSTTMEVLHTAFQSTLVMEWATTAATAMVALEVSLRLMNGNLPFNIALTVLLLTPEFFLPIRQFALKFHVGTAGKAAAQRIYVILDTPVKEAVQTRGKRQLSKTKRLDIRFVGVTYTYEEGRQPALQDFSMNLPQGRRLVLVGPTGAGKTTISQLLLRFARPDSGRITVGGLPLEDIDADTWLKQVAWVPQLPHLFHGSISDNIRLARPNATKEEVISSAKAAYAHEFIAALPQGYDTRVGEDGARLSGGQRQRLAIARAILKDAPFLILDEPTSHLDRQSEQIVRQTLDWLMAGRTVLIIAHRMELAYEADQIVVMEQGRKVESGFHSDLLARNGSYSQLVASYNGRSRSEGAL